MKKQVITGLLAVALVLGTTSISFGQEEAKCITPTEIFTKLNIGQNCKDYFNQLCDKFAGNQSFCPSTGSGSDADNNQQNNSDNNTNTDNNTNSDSNSNSNNNTNSDSNSNTNTNTNSGAVNAGTNQTQVLSLVNKERSAAGLSSLSMTSELNKVAQLKAEDMAKNGYFSHTSPTYGSAFDMLAANSISYRTAGENIAKGQKTAQAVMNGWMNSQGHRANILNGSYTKMGVGYALDSNGSPCWVQIFIG